MPYFFEQLKSLKTGEIKNLNIVFPPKSWWRARLHEKCQILDLGFLCSLKLKMADELPVTEGSGDDHRCVVIKQTDDTKGKALFATKSFTKGDVIFEEKPLVCVQFVWNAEYKYRACDHCLRSLESAQDMARRLSGDPSLELPYVEKCCEVSKCQQFIVTCPRCQVTNYKANVFIIYYVDSCHICILHLKIKCYYLIETNEE